MKAFSCLVVAAALAACSTSPSGGTSSSSAASATGTSTGGINPLTTGGSSGGGNSTGATSGGTTTGGQCQTSWPPSGCLAIATCGCIDGTDQEFGCIGPPTCTAACCEHGGPADTTARTDAGLCQTSWPARGCLAEAICTCQDESEQEFGCLGPPTCAEACCAHDGPAITPPPSDAGPKLPDGGVCQTWSPLPCDAIFDCHCEDGMTEEAGCAGPPTCTAACCGHEGPIVDGGASDGGECQTNWPERGCLAESICGCSDGTSQEFGCVGPPSCDDACCGHGGPGAPPDGGPQVDAGSAPDSGFCPVWPPLPCDAIVNCDCGDGTTELAACAGPPNCADACCGHDGVKP